MTSTSRHLRAGLLTGCAVVALLGQPVLAQGNAGQVSKAPPPAEVVKDANFTDLREHNKEIEAWKKQQQDELRRQGKATAEEFRKIDEAARARAHAKEPLRTKALESLSEKSGITIEQGKGGSHPTSAEGRGSFSDIDTNSMSPKDYQQVLETARKNGYTIEAKGDSFTIKEIDVTVHRKSASEMHYGSGEQVGSSGRDAEIQRGSNKETALDLKKADPAITVTDNLKKASKALSAPPDTLSNADLQALGKMTQRNAEVAGAVKGGPDAPASKDARTLQQAEDLKKGYSPEAAGIVRENATPEQRNADIADFQRRATDVTHEAVRAADTHANTQMESLASEARHANDVLEGARATGDPARIRDAEARAAAAETAVIDYQQVRTNAQQSAVNADSSAAKVINEARGVSNEGKSPSEVREAAVGPDRKALTDAAADPLKGPTPKVEPAKPASDPSKPTGDPATSGTDPAKPVGEPVKTGTEPAAPGSETTKAASGADTAKPASAPEPKGGATSAEPVKPHTPTEPVKTAGAPDTVKTGGAPEGSLKSKGLKGAGFILDIYSTYESVKRAAEEAGKEAAEGGDGALKSTAKVVGYSAWHAIGIGGALETGKKAGEDSAKQWEKDVRAGSVDPNSKLSQAWARVRAVGWGLAEFTGLQTIKDATVEGAGYVKDRYTQYKNEKAEAEAKAARGEKPGPEKPGPEKPGGNKPDASSSVADRPKPDAVPAKGPDGKPLTQPDKAAMDKAAADKLAADKAAAEKAVADKIRRPIEKDKPIGSAIGAAGTSSVKQPVAAPQPVVQQPVVPPPPPTTTEVEGGYVTDKNGTTKVIYIIDAKGNRLGGYYIKLDPNGREISRENFTEKPAEPAPVSLDGTYAGRITGGSSGSLRITVRGGHVNGTIGGTHQGDPISATFSASLAADGSFSAPATGTLRDTSSLKSQSYGFTGQVSGRINGTSGAGSWSGGNQWGRSKGTWSAAK